MLPDYVDALVKEIEYIGLHAERVDQRAERRFGGPGGPRVQHQPGAPGQQVEREGLAQVAPDQEVHQPPRLGVVASTEIDVHLQAHNLRR